MGPPPIGDLRRCGAPLTTGWPCSSGSPDGAAYLQRGNQLGSELDDWLQAEEEIRNAEDEAIDDAIDEASEESFPASDPPSLLIVEPHETSHGTHHRSAASAGQPDTTRAFLSQFFDKDPECSQRSDHWQLLCKMQHVSECARFVLV